LRWQKRGHWRSGSAFQDSEGRRQQGGNAGSRGDEQVVTNASRAEASSVLPLASHAIDWLPDDFR
jgi:hypothetical protein